MVQDGSETSVKQLINSVLNNLKLKKCSYLCIIERDKHPLKQVQRGADDWPAPSLGQTPLYL